jgi:hypothetical protein
MSGLDWVGLTTAFLAALPPPRPERPETERSNARMACLLAGLGILMSLSTFFVAWSVHRNYDAFRARCEVFGGRVTNVPDMGLPFRCSH